MCSCGPQAAGSQLTSPSHTMCRSDLMQRCLFLCALISDGSVCAALPLLAANHSTTCLPSLRGQGGVKDRKEVSEALFSVSLLNFLAQSTFVMDWTGFCCASRAALDEVQKKAHQQNQKAFFQHKGQRCLVLLLKKIMLNGTDPMSLSV